MSSDSLSIPYELLNFLFLESPVGIGAYTQERGLLDMNHTLEQLFGYTAEEINELGGPAALLADTAFLESVRRSLAESGEFEGTLPFRRKDGETVWHSVRTRAIGNAQGVGSGSVSWHTDVSQAHELAERLGVSEKRFDEIMELIPEAVTIRAGGKLEFANGACERVYGHPLEQLRGSDEPVVAWALPEEKHKVRALYQALNRGDAGGVHSRQYRIRTAKGAVRWIWTRIFPLGGSPPRAMALSADITDTIEAADRLREKTRDADQANRAKSAFLANLSHEIRTPVAGILGLLDLMENEPEEKQREYRDLMRDAAGSLVRMLEDVLDLSRIESNRLSILPGETDISEALGSVISLMRPRAKERQVELRLQVHSGVPTRCSIDRVRFQQLASNIVSNAIKYTDDGTISVDLSYIEGSGGAGRALLQVEDTGAGMSEGQLSLAFEPFRRLNEGFTQTSDGAGLGLPLVKSLVDLMGGTLDVSSTPGSGTRFAVSLPAPVVEPHDAGASRSSEAVTPETGERVVLLAEDNRIVQLTAQTQLSRAGHQVYVANNGQEAVEIAGRHRVDLVLMDIQMPVMNGLDAIRRIRSDEPSGNPVPIVALTAYSSRDDQEEFFKAGVQEILTKPCSAAELLHAVGKHARRPE